MKPHPNQKRRAGRSFNGIDKETGYAVRFEMTRQDWWASKPNAFPAYSLANSLRTVRRHTNEAIHYSIDAAVESGRPIPAPEWQPTSIPN